jgi:hypothetical protein
VWRFDIPATCQVLHGRDFSGLQFSAKLKSKISSAEGFAKMASTERVNSGKITATEICEVKVASNQFYCMNTQNIVCSSTNFRQVSNEITHKHQDFFPQLIFINSRTKHNTYILYNSMTQKGIFQLEK